VHVDLSHDVFDVDELRLQDRIDPTLLFDYWIWKACFRDVWFLSQNDLLNGFDGIVIGFCSAIPCQISQ